MDPLAVTGAYQIGERFNSPSDTSRPAPADGVARTPGLSFSSVSSVSARRGWARWEDATG